MKEYYLDSASTTKPKEEVIQAMLPYLTEKWHNPSSKYNSSINVKKDIITEVTDLATGFSALTGTQVDITPAEGKNLNVSVNDEAITADNGVYSFNVTAATAVKIEEATGINSISSDDKADNKVYTVQGVRVNNVKNLPAGLYIVNGKTRVVK